MKVALVMYQSIPSAVIPPPRAFDPRSAPHGGALTRIEARPIGHLTRRKNAGHRSRVKWILYSMSQVIIYVDICDLQCITIFGNMPL